MVDNTVSQINYTNYSYLLRLIYPRMLGMSVFDRDGQILWKEEYGQTDFIGKIDAYISIHSINFHDIKNTVTTYLLNNDEILYLRGLHNEEEAPGVIIALLMTLSENSDSPQDLSIHDVFHAIAMNIGSEIELHTALEASEKELNTMATELTERYEELNLVYEADNNAMNGMQSLESLRQLVRNCTEYLDVGLTVLIIPEKKITIYEFNEHNHVQNTAGLIKSLTGEFYNSLKTYKQTIVINSVQDAIRNRILSEVPLKMIVTPVQTGEEEVIGMLIIVNSNWKADFTNSDRNLLHVMSKKVSKVIQATYDDLTGLINKHSFEYNLKDALSQVHSQGVGHALLNIDIDRLGVINETSGAEAGDKLLRIVARTLCKMVRNRDVVARLGGDAFGVLLESCPMDTASVVAKNISSEIYDLSFEWKGERYDTSVSIGVVPISSVSESIAMILSSSEMARNAAKERGVNQIVIYEQDDIDLLRRRDEIKWVTRIQSAMRDGRFQLHCQLIEGFTTENDDHYEILLRMVDENGILIFPDQFLSAAEHFNLMPELDRWVIKTTIENLLVTIEYLQPPPCKVAINLSGQSLCDEGFQNYICKHVRRLGSYSHMLGFEITESAAIANLKQARELIDILKKEGCSIALDDFGTGLSSFAYLQSLNVDYLKIDGSFVHRMVDDQVARTMVSAINQVGHAMGLRTIAEYAENDQIITQLKQIGVDYGQGFGLGRPTPFLQLLKDLSEHSLTALSSGECQ